MEQDRTDRKAAEAHFHDHLRDELPWQRYSLDAETEVASDPNWSNFKFYSIEQSSRAYTDNWIVTRCEGKRLLDYGCGNGEDARLAASHGATAFGIDISPVSIENATGKATSDGLADRATFLVMDAESLDFPDEYFDIVVVYGVLHHLDFSKAMREIARVLKRDGEVICTEALAHNPLINAYRRRTPHLRTEWEVEHIMRRETIATASQWFSSVSCRFYHLSTLAAVPFRRTRAFGPLVRGFRLLDAIILRLPVIKWQAWQVVFTLSGPRKGGAMFGDPPPTREP